VRPRTIVLSFLLLAVVGGLAAGMYAYDDARADKIGKGVRVGGISLQGLTREQARAKLERLILEPLRRPVVVHHDRSTWRLGAREARISVDIDAMVNRAMDVSRDGNILSRTVRNLTGKSLNARMEPTVRYSDKAIVRMLDKIRRAIDRDPIDATVKIDSSGIQRRDSRTGLAVRASLLHKNIRKALVSTTADRTFIARTRKLRPKVTTSELDERYARVIIVHRDQFKLTLYKQLKPAKTYSIAVGKVGLETPAGLYRIQNKAVNPAWNVPNSDWAGDLAGTVVPGGTPENPLKARWLGIFDGAGIHGTDAINSIGTAASHGCIRMRIPDVIELYDEVPVGAPVYIA
jgi:lipoprotein-anchoring transpeptidase ErfK/SrfK